MLLPYNWAPFTTPCLIGKCRRLTSFPEHRSKYSAINKLIFVLSHLNVSIDSDVGFCQRGRMELMNLLLRRACKLSGNELIGENDVSSCCMYG